MTIKNRFFWILLVGGLIGTWNSMAMRKAFQAPSTRPRAVFQLGVTPTARLGGTPTAGPTTTLLRVKPVTKVPFARPPIRLAPGIPEAALTTPLPRPTAVRQAAATTIQRFLRLRRPRAPARLVVTPARPRVGVAVGPEVPTPLLGRLPAARPRPTVTVADVGVQAPTPTPTPPRPRPAFRPLEPDVLPTPPARRVVAPRAQVDFDAGEISLRDGTTSTVVRGLDDSPISVGDDTFFVDSQGALRRASVDPETGAVGNVDFATPAEREFVVQRSRGATPAEVEATSAAAMQQRQALDTGRITRQAGGPDATPDDYAHVAAKEAIPPDQRLQDAGPMSDENLKFQKDQAKYGKWGVYMGVGGILVGLVTVPIMIWQMMDQKTMMAEQMKEQREMTKEQQEWQEEQTEAQMVGWQPLPDGRWVKYRGQTPVAIYESDQTTLVTDDPAKVAATLTGAQDAGIAAGAAGAGAAVGIAAGTSAGCSQGYCGTYDADGNIDWADERTGTPAFKTDSTGQNILQDYQQPAGAGAGVGPETGIQVDRDGNLYRLRPDGLIEWLDPTGTRVELITDTDGNIIQDLTATREYSAPAYGAPATGGLTGMGGLTREEQLRLEALMGAGSLEQLEEYWSIQ